MVLEIRNGPLKQLWVARHENVRPGEGFVDVQESGPFASWRHAHRMAPDGPGHATLEDRVEYELPFGAAGRFLGKKLVRRKLERMFRYRHRITRDDLAAHASRRRSMKVIVSGAGGLIGGALVPFLTTGGHEVSRLVRSDSRAGGEAIHWDPDRGELDAGALEGADAVVHLAGENIAARRWSPERKRRIRESRIRGTSLLAAALGRCSKPPGVLISASAVGYYGNRGAEEIVEESGAGDGFLADVCRDWEAAAEAAGDSGIRVVTLRMGVVLSPADGALRRLLLPFRLLAGGRLGSGRQHVSWIALDDLLYAILHAMTESSLSGPLNAVSPGPVTQGEFAAVLGKVLGRPALLPMPAWAARRIFGEIAGEVLLASQRARPARLVDSGFQFRHESLDSALRHLLGLGGPAT